MEKFNYHLAVRTANKKLGNYVAASTTSSNSCPTDCPMATVCYGKKGPASWHWNKVNKGDRGSDYTTFLSDVQTKLANGQLFRINVTGDLSHTDGYIDSYKLGKLDRLCSTKGLMTWTYTHHHQTKDRKLANLKTIKEASRTNFCINLSTEKVGDALELHKQGHSVSIANAQLFKHCLDQYKRGNHKPNIAKDGYKADLIACPEQRPDLAGKVTCSKCRLCTMHSPNKRAIVVFDIH